MSYNQVTRRCAIRTHGGVLIPKRKRNANMKKRVKACKANKTYWKNHRATRKNMSDWLPKQPDKATRAALRRRLRVRLGVSDEWMNVTKAIKTLGSWSELKKTIIWEAVVGSHKGKHGASLLPRWWIYGMYAGVLNRQAFLDIIGANRRKLNPRRIKLARKKVTKRKKAKGGKAPKPRKERKTPEPYVDINGLVANNSNFTPLDSVAPAWMGPQVAPVYGIPGVAPFLDKKRITPKKMIPGLVPGNSNHAFYDGVAKEGKARAARAPAWMKKMNLSPWLWK